MRNGPLPVMRNGEPGGRYFVCSCAAGARSPARSARALPPSSWSRAPAGVRIGEPEDIANAVVFLASPESGWITAQVLTVDGGRMDYIGHG